MKKSKDYSTIYDCLSLFLLCLLVYLSNGRTIGSGDTVPNTLLAFNFLKNNILHFENFRDSYLMSLANGYFFTESLHGELTSVYPIGVSIITFPVYLIFYVYWKIASINIDIVSQEFEVYRLLFEKLAATITTSIAVIFFYLASRIKFPRITSFISTFIYAFATNTWVINSQGLWQHGPSNLALIICIYCLLKASELTNRKTTSFFIYLLVAGIFAGLLPGIRPTNSIFTVATLIYSIVIFRIYSAFLCVGLLSAVPSLVWNWYNFGNLSGGYSTAFHGNIPYIFTLNHFITTALGLLISPSRGLLIFSPILIFALFGAIFVFQNLSNKDEQLIGVMTLSSLFLFSSYCFYIVWWAGHSYGPRFMTDFIPIPCYLINYYLISKNNIKFRLNKKINYFVFPAVLIVSIFIQVVGAYVSPGISWNSIPLDIDQYSSRSWEIKDNQIERHTRATLARIFPPLVENEEYVSGLSGKINKISQASKIGGKITSFPVLVQSGTQVILKAQVENTGPSKWFGYESALEKGEVRVRVRFFDENNNYLTESRLFVSGQPKQNEVSEAIGTIHFPQYPGNYRLEFDLIAEGIKDFTDSYPVSKIIRVIKKDQVLIPQSTSFDFISDSSQSLDIPLAIDGLGGLEKNFDNQWRWALGEKTTIAFNLYKDQLLDLSFSFYNPIHNQNVTIEVNGKIVENINHIDANTMVEKQIQLEGKTGINTISFIYKDWNGNKTNFAPNDTRPMSISFNSLNLK